MGADQSSSARKGLSKVLLVFSLLFFLFSQAMLLHKIITPLTDAKWYLDIPHHKQSVTDFFQYYQVSALARSDQSHRVYDPEVQRQWYENLISPLHMEKIFYNQQPPFLYPLILPLSILPANYAYPLWCLAQTVFGLLSLYLVSRLGPLSARDRKLVLLGILSSLPAYLCLWHGNTTFWILGLLALYVLFLYNRKDTLAGLVLAFSTIKPQYIFVMTVPAIAMRRWRTIAALLFTEALLMALAVPVIGWENVIDYPHIVANAESNPDFIGVRPFMMISLRGLFGQFMSIKGSLQATSALMFVSLIPLYMFWRRTLNRPGVDSLRWGWAITFIAAVLLSPHAHVFDALLLSVAAVLTLPDLSLRLAANREAANILHRIWCSIMILYPPLSWLANCLLGFERAPLFFFLPCNIVLFAVALMSAGLALRQADGK